jgi:hypothetical protein
MLLKCLTGFAATFALAATGLYWQHQESLAGPAPKTAHTSSSLQSLPVSSGVSDDVKPGRLASGDDRSSPSGNTDLLASFANTPTRPEVPPAVAERPAVPTTAPPALAPAPVTQGPPTYVAGSLAGVQFRAPGPKKTGGCIGCGQKK